MPSVERITDQEFNILKDLIYKHTGIYLSPQKKILLVTRLYKRLKALNLKTFKDYYSYLLNHPDRRAEWVQMINHITTNTTEFFRERYHFIFLQNEVLPYFLKKRTNKRLYIWSAGCSTGEEAYSIAITLSEFFGDYSGWNIKILATDVNSDAIAIARKGVYKTASVKRISKVILRKYFEEVSSIENKRLFKVKDRLRRMVIFKNVNLVKNYLGKICSFDIIFCRNVIIYFHPESQTKLIDQFYELLRDDGFLFMGHSEALFSVSRKFQLVDHSVYQKILNFKKSLTN